jgi:KaiC/GvpD/RAD55 family RecA-like ATPase
LWGYPLIPGIYLPIQRLGPKILLLSGPPGAGKTMYCRQFLLEGLVKGDKCIFISTDLSRIQFNTLFYNPESSHVPGNIEFINPLGDEVAAGEISGKKLTTAILSALKSSLGIKLMAERKITSSSSGQNRYNASNNIDGITSKPIRFVIDSMSHTLLLLGERMLIEFVMDLSSILKKLNVTAILTLTTPSTDQGIMGNLSSIVDGIIEMRMKEDSNDVPIRSIRVRHLKGVYYEPKWINFKISGNGTLEMDSAHLISKLRLKLHAHFATSQL